MPKATKSKPMPKFTRAPEALVQQFATAMQDFPMAEQRKMFGYPSAFVNGQMFASLFGDNLIMRLSEEDRARFITEHQTKLFEPVPGRPMKEYVVVPDAIVQSPAQLGKWLKRAAAYAQSLPPKTKATRKRAR